MLVRKKIKVGVKMRAIAFIIVGCFFLVSLSGQAAVLQNHDFETGDMTGWGSSADQLTIGASTNSTFNRNYAARMQGTFSGDHWITNTIYQDVAVNGGDAVNAVGFFNWESFVADAPNAEGRVTISLNAPHVSVAQTWTEPTAGWRFFDLTIGMPGIVNGNFESGNLDGWFSGADDMELKVINDRNYESGTGGWIPQVDQGSYALRIDGEWPAAGETNTWSFNQVAQVLYLHDGDVVDGFVRMRIEEMSISVTSGWIAAGIKIEGGQSDISFSEEEVIQLPSQELPEDGWHDYSFSAVIATNGYYMFRCMVAGDTDGGTNSGTVYFDDARLTIRPAILANAGFEDGTNDWLMGADDLTLDTDSSIVFEGTNSLRMSGSWTNWSFNAGHQVVSLCTGDVVHARGKIYIDDFANAAGWAVAGIKLESTTYPDSMEHIYDQNDTKDTWLDLSFDMVISNAGEYVMRIMVCGDVGASPAVADIYFDDLQFWRDGEGTGAVNDISLKIEFAGFSGGSASNATTDVYLDSIMFQGSTVGIESPTEIYNVLKDDAAVIAAAPSESDVPDVVYPPLNSYGYVGGTTNPVNYGSHTESAVAGWRFRYFTNDVVVTITNTIILSEMGGGPGYFEFDFYQYCARNWGTLRGTSPDIDTNAPYWKLGLDDDQGGEFGMGPFPKEHTFVVGQDSLTNFPRFMSSHTNDTWPSTLHVVYDENLGDFDRSYDKYFVLDTIATNGPDSNVKALKFWLSCQEPGNTNLDFNTQEIHLGWGSEAESQGMIDYPNCTYQDHNEVFLRAGWEYGMLDQDGWFMPVVPRGSATIEPINLYVWKQGNWMPKSYEEYLFAWPNAASGVRSVFDDDETDMIAGQGSYCVGYKIGHQNGTNEMGEAQFPQIIELRGNGYFRMTDYDGVMGGSFRPVSMDIFGLYQYKEDAPLMPEAYARLVPRTTPTNETDDSYIQIMMPVRSKTNHWLTGAAKMDAHFAPEEVNDEGAYFDLQTDLYANKAIVRSNDGPLNAFAQVDMYWRGGDAVDDHSEGHDFDAIMIRKTDGEWITHLPVNPPTNIYHRTISSFKSGDAVYIMQQDRAPMTYGFSTEAPYRKVSSFEITLLDDGGRDMSLDLYEQNTISEINDNVVVACTINEDIDKGDEISFKYRYRGIYSPGVVLLNPNESGGDENWSNNIYTIDFYATDGEDELLQANLYYGNGLDEDWTLINTNELLLVPEATHYVSYDWEVSDVPPGAYYIKAEAQRSGGGKIGFDLSNTRLQVGPTLGFVNNGLTNVTVATNMVGYLGTNMSFETGDLAGWAFATDDPATVDIYASSVQHWEGSYAARVRGNWDDWGWNNLQQQVTCISGEVLHVQGRVYIGQFDRYGTNWLRCGIKLENTNDPSDFVGMEFDDAFSTGVWLNVDFQRTAPFTGTERLLLWVGGHDCTFADVFFDDLKVMSTNTGVVVTNEIRLGYWEGDAAEDVSAHDDLVFDISASDQADDAQVWVSDSSGQTNAVAISNYVDHIISFPQRVRVPWSAFSGIDKTAIQSLGFVSPATNDIAVSRVRSLEEPLRVSVAFVDPAHLDMDGMPHYNAADEIVQVVTIENVSGANLTNVQIQLLQEYGENVMWDDTSHHDSRPSHKTRIGDRLCGGVETFWTNMTIANGGTLVLTNSYTMPVGRLIDHLAFAIPSEDDWFIFRNYEAHAQVHVVVREVGGDNVYDDGQVGYYSIDDDFDMDNDGLPDYWEQMYGTSQVSMLPDEDDDNDGYTNLEEYEAGSDPTDPDSYPGHISEYTLHLAYENGVDLFPQASAEQSNYTGAASCWMIASYLNGESFTQSQDQIFAANTADPVHNNEITPQSCANWMHQNTDSGYYFSARYRTNLNEALKETVYWMDYTPPGGLKSPVYILCGTSWNYQVVRGFQTDQAPYDGGSGVTTASTYTIYGVWLNDPKMSGLGYDVYATAEEMDAVYRPSTADGKYWLVAEPTEDTGDMAYAQTVIGDSAAFMNVAEPHDEMSDYIADFDGSEAEIPPLADILPSALEDDAGFMTLFDQVESTNCYIVNQDDPANEYILAAGGVRGPGSTVYILKLATNGSMQRATWDADESMYPPVLQDAAEWMARQDLTGGVGYTEATFDGGTNILLNEGFESNTGGGGTAAPWVNSVGSAGPENWANRSGSWGMALYSWGGSTASCYQEITNLGFGEYTFTVWLQKDAAFAASDVSLRVNYIDASGQTSSWQGVSVQSSLDETWREYKITIQKYSYSIQTMQFAVQVSGISGGGALKVDDASVIKTAGLLFNPDFEDYSSAWDVGVGLTAWPEAWAARTGTYGMSIVSWLDTHGFFSQIKHNIPQGRYTYSIWMKKDAGFTADTVALQLEWLDSGQNVIGAVTNDVYAQITTGWQEFQIQAVAPTNMYSMRCVVDAANIVSGSDAMQCDDAELMLEQGSDYTLVDADLVYDAQVDVSPFLPRWQLVFEKAGDYSTSTVYQAEDFSGDVDGDGMRDGAELYAGFDPDDAGSVFSLNGGLGVVSQPDNVELAWLSVAGKSYSIYQTTNINEAFTLLQANVSATPPINTYPVTLSDTRVFYRIETE